MFAFTQNEIDQIEAARDAGDYHVAYEYIYTFASDTDMYGNMTPKAGVDPAVWVWFWAAKDINDPNGSGGHCQRNRG